MHCDKIVLGSMNLIFCVIIRSGLWLEFFMPSNACAMSLPHLLLSLIFQGFHGGGLRMKNLKRTSLAGKVLELENFKSGVFLESHSIFQSNVSDVRQCGVCRCPVPPVLLL
jgi:hypothetical protein